MHFCFSKSDDRCVFLRIVFFSERIEMLKFSRRFDLHWDNMQSLLGDVASTVRCYAVTSNKVWISSIFRFAK